MTGVKEARVAIVTVSYDSEAVLGPFLASITSSFSGPEPIVVVADNKPGSEQGTAIRELCENAGARYLPLPQNAGYGHAVNVAVAGLPPGISSVLISNPDVVLHPGSLDRLVRTLQDDVQVGAVGPRILEADGSTYPSARAVPSIRNGVGHAVFSTIWPSNPWTSAYRTAAGGEPTRRDAGWLSGACLLVRRSTFDDIGGFDTGYFMYFEDVDLGYRLGRSGWRNVYEPEAVVLHTGAHSTSGESAAMLEAHHKSAQRFLSLRYSGWWRWPLRAALTLGLKARWQIVKARNARRSVR